MGKALIFFGLINAKRVLISVFFSLFCVGASANGMTPVKYKFYLLISRDDNLCRPLERLINKTGPFLENFRPDRNGYDLPAYPDPMPKGLENFDQLFYDDIFWNGQPRFFFVDYRENDYTGYNTIYVFKDELYSATNFPAVVLTNNGVYFKEKYIDFFIDFLSLDRKYILGRDQYWADEDSNIENIAQNFIITFTHLAGQGLKEKLIASLSDRNVFQGAFMFDDHVYFYSLPSDPQDGYFDDGANEDPKATILIYHLNSAHQIVDVCYFSRSNLDLPLTHLPRAGE